MGFFDWVSDVAKSLPVVGHVVAAVQAATGDTEGARRTVASATGNLIATVATVAGAVGSPLGAAAAGAAGSVVGNMVERGINGEHIETDPTRIALQATIGAASGLTGGTAGALAGGTATKIVGQTVTKTALGAAATTTVAQSLEAIKQGKGDRGGDQENGTGENQVRVVGPQTAARAREFEQHYANQLRDPLLGKLAPRAASLSDFIANTTVYSSGVLQVDYNWVQASTTWQMEMNAWTASELKKRILTTEEALAESRAKSGVRITMGDIEAKLTEVDEKRKAVTKTLKDEAVYKQANLAKQIPSIPTHPKST